MAFHFTADGSRGLERKDSSAWKLSGSVVSSSASSLGSERSLPREVGRLWVLSPARSDQRL